MVAGIHLNRYSSKHGKNACSNIREIYHIKLIKSEKIYDCINPTMKIQTSIEHIRVQVALKTPTVLLPSVAARILLFSFQEITPLLSLQSSGRAKVPVTAKFSSKYLKILLTIACHQNTTTSTQARQSTGINASL